MPDAVRWPSAVGQCLCPWSLPSAPTPPSLCPRSSSSPLVFALRRYCPSSSPLVFALYRLQAFAGLPQLKIIMGDMFSRSGVCRSQALLAGKTAIITGSNTGIGKATAIDLARRNARVILACRSVEKGENAVIDVRQESGNEDVVFRHLDLASLASVRQFATQILEEEPRIDILINNAGVFGCPYSKTEDGFEMHFGVNHLGHFLLTNLLLEKMKEAPAARIVNVSADLYRLCSGIKFDDLEIKEGYGPTWAYVHSKLANILFTNALARRLEGTRVTTNSLHPGVIVETELGRHSREWSPVIYTVMTSVMGLFTKSLEQGAQTTIYCAVAEELEGVSGRYYKDCREVALNRCASDSEAGERLWEVSAQMVGLDSEEQ